MAKNREPVKRAAANLILEAMQIIGQGPIRTKLGENMHMIFGTINTE